MKTHTREWWKSARIGKEKDGRRKITDAQRERMKTMYRDGAKIREIARVFDGVCSRRLVQLVLFPERAEAMARRAKEAKVWRLYHNTGKRRAYMRTHRANIRKLHALHG